MALNVSQRERQFVKDTFPSEIEDIQDIRWCEKRKVRPHPLPLPFPPTPYNATLTVYTHTHTHRTMEKWLPGSSS